MRSGWKKIIITSACAAGIYIAMRMAAGKGMEDGCIDDGNPYLASASAPVKRNLGAYEAKVKPLLDHIFSFIGLVVFSPLFIIIALAIVVDNPGSVFFVQKRVGKGGHFIKVHKFRSMRSNAPHNVPTHKLASPERYITRVGGLLRKTSLDELPQIWDIFCGRMSMIGPRPALWNQRDLVKERDRYGANDVMPGLTGLAQISGRDGLDITAKAALDGQYVEILRKGGAAAFWQDVKCLFNTAGAVLRRDGVIEGGAGAAKKAVP